MYKQRSSVCRAFHEYLEIEKALSSEKKASSCTRTVMQLNWGGGSMVCLSFHRVNFPSKSRICFAGRNNALLIKRNKQE